MLDYTKILCALDFDEHARTVLLLATGVAKESNAVLYIVHVARVPAADMDVPTAFDADPRWEREARARLENIVSQNRDAQLRYEIRVVSGLPSVDIVRMANEWQVDLIVMATHGRKGFSHLVLGSIAERVIREATCPVLVVRPRRPKEDLPTSSA